MTKAKEISGRLLCRLGCHVSDLIFWLSKGLASKIGYLVILMKSRYTKDSASVYLLSLFSFYIGLRIRVLRVGF